MAVAVADGVAEVAGVAGVAGAAADGAAGGAGAAGGRAGGVAGSGVPVHGVRAHGDRHVAASTIAGVSSCAAVRHGAAPSGGKPLVAMTRGPGFAPGLFQVLQGSAA